MSPPPTLSVSIVSPHSTLIQLCILYRIYFEEDENVLPFHMVWLSGSGYNIIVCIIACGNNHACIALAALEQTTRLISNTLALL